MRWLTCPLNQQSSVLCLEISAALFLEVLHSAIRKAVRERTDDIVEGGALQLGSGWLHIQGRLLFDVLLPLGVRVPCLKLTPFSAQTNVIFQLSVELAIRTISSRLYALRKERYDSRPLSYLLSLSVHLKHQPHTANGPRAHADGEP